ncbi:hypothetical protein D9M71_769110 [compost metagenome]
MPLLDWSLRTRPASTWVSPSRRRRVVWALRVSTWTGMVPAWVGASVVALLTSRAILIATSLFRCTVGCTSSFRPTSR